MDVLIVFNATPYDCEQKENGEQPLQSFFGSLLDDCPVCWSSSHLSKMEHGTTALNRI
jgi:hypothetical protein